MTIRSSSIAEKSFFYVCSVKRAFKWIDVSNWFDREHLLFYRTEVAIIHKLLLIVMA